MKEKDNKLTLKMSIQDAIEFLDLLSLNSHDRMYSIKNRSMYLGIDSGIMEDVPANPEFEWSLLLDRIQYLKNVN